MQLEQYLSYLALQTKSKETLRAYRQTLERFMSFLDSHGIEVVTVTRKTLEGYLQYLADNSGRTKTGRLAASTIVRNLGILSSFFQYLIDVEELEMPNPVKKMKRPTVRNIEPRAINDEALKSLIDGITDVRDRAIILTFVESGLRLSELVQLNKDSINAQQNSTLTGTVEFYGFGEVIGKGNKLREFLIGPKALQALREYLLACRLDDSEPALFTSIRAVRISTRSVQDILSRWCRRLNLDHSHVHQLRHSFATRNVNAGMQLPVLQSILGHASPNTTSRYFSIRPERKIREYFSTMEFLSETSDL